MNNENYKNITDNNFSENLKSKIAQNHQYIFYYYQNKI